MRDQRTFIVLLVLTLVLFFGWQKFLAWKWPPPTPPQPVAKLKLTRAQYGDLVRAGTTAVLPDLPALGSAIHLATAAHLAHSTERDTLLTAHLDALRRKRLEEIAKAAGAHRTLTLGDDSTNLKVELTSRGAGVQSVTLNKFKAADRYGKPAEGPLRLIPGEDENGNKLPPAFCLYHFQPGPEDPNARPWDKLGELNWQLVEDSVKKSTTEDGSEFITAAAFRTEVPGEDVIIHKTYTLAPGEYHIGLSVKLERKPGGTDPLLFRYQLAGGRRLPIEGEWYTGTFRTALVGQADARNNVARNYQESRKISVEQGGKEVDKHPDRVIRYAGVAVQFFTSTLVVDNRQEVQDFLQRARPTLPWTGYATNDKRPQLDDITMRVNTKALDLKPGTPIEHKYVLYHGPVKVALLGELATGGGKGVSEDLIRWYKDDLRLDTLTDYHYQMEGPAGWMSRFFNTIGWTWVLIFFTNLMHSVLNWLHLVVLNYGVCIILLTILVRGVMYPISRKQALASVKMQALAPDIKKLREKHKDDPLAAHKAVQELFRKNGVNQFGTCWIMLLQMPIFMGLYYALQESIHFRLAGFLWMDNLAAPDMLFGWGESIPWLTHPEDQGGFFYLGPYFNLLPIIAVALMVVQQKLFTPPPADEQQEMQMKMMKYMMIFMGLLFYKVASGLALYFIISTAWGLAERRFLPKAQPTDGTPAAPAKPVPAPKGKGKAEKGKKAKNATIQKVQDWWEKLRRQAEKK